MVSFDFAVGIVPGWHATIFPPYFVAGAIYSGFAMVLTLAIPLRKIYGMEDFITMRHLENMGKVTLVTGLIVAYGYISEAFFGWYSANKYEGFMILNRMTGPYWYMYWTLIFCNIITPQWLWIAEGADNTPLGAVPRCVAMVVNVGMWLERFVIVVTSLHRDFLPSSWGMYHGTIWDWMTFIGTLGMFLTLFFIFIRLLPMISIFEMRTMAPEGEAQVARRRATDGHAHQCLPPAIYGLMAEFDAPDARLVRAARRTYAAGYRKIDTFSPYPIEEAWEAIAARSAAVADRAGRRPTWDA